MLSSCSAPANQSGGTADTHRADVGDMFRGAWGRKKDLFDEGGVPAVCWARELAAQLCIM